MKYANNSNWGRDHLDALYEKLRESYGPVNQWPSQFLDRAGKLLSRIDLEEIEKTSKEKLIKLLETLDDADILSDKQVSFSFF